MKRNETHAIRSALHTCEFSIPKIDRSNVAELERDLAATAACALWDGDTAKVVSCLRRLAARCADERKAMWENLYLHVLVFLRGWATSFQAYA